MISIVTATYNSEKYIEQCILSVMNQTTTDYEHIIVDGGSTDSTIDIIKRYEGKYPVRWISEKDNGMYDAISKGFGMAKGDILCWLNSDDMYMPWTLKTVSRLMSDQVQWITGAPSYFTEDGIGYVYGGAIKPVPRKFIARGWMEGRRLWSIQQESTFWTRELYDKCGGLNPDYKLAGDYHLWKNMAEFADLYYVNSTLAGFRIHENQLSSNRLAYQKEIGELSLFQRFLSKIKFYKIYYKVYSKLAKRFSGKNYPLIFIR